MTAFERRNEILRILRLRKFEKVENLAFEFSVSPRTIRQDVLMLSLNANIITKQGRYDGGIYYIDDNNLPTQAKITLLKKLKNFCNEEEQAIMKKILKDYGA